MCRCLSSAQILKHLAPNTTYTHSVNQHRNSSNCLIDPKPCFLSSHFFCMSPNSGMREGIASLGLRNGKTCLNNCRFCRCPCAQELVLPSVPLLVLESLRGVWSKSGMNSGFRRQRWGAGRGLCLYQLILLDFCQLMEAGAGDSSCLPPQLPEQSVEHAEQAQ